MGLWSRIFVDGTVTSPDLVLVPGQVDQSKTYMAFPGTIDLSRLKFHVDPPSESISHINNDIRQQSPDQIEEEEEETYLDIAIFPLPIICSTQPRCDLPRLGIGKVESFNGFSTLSLCHQGRLFIQEDFYEGYHGSIPVPMQGRMPKHIDDGTFYVKEGQVEYAIIVTNCNSMGRTVRTTGEILIEYGEQSTTPSYMTEAPQYMLTSLAVFCLMLRLFVRIRWIPSTTQYQSVEIEGNSSEDSDLEDPDASYSPDLV